MTSTHPSGRDTPSSDHWNNALDHLNHALDAEEMADTNYHIREALQLLHIDDHNRDTTG